MDLEDLLATLHVRVRHNDLTVKPSGPQQRGIEHIGPVGGGYQDDALIGFEAVHLDEKLVQRLLAFVVAAAETRTTVAADSVDFVNEDDARRILLGLLEHIADPRGTDAHEHFDEVRAGDCEERHIGFAGNGARQQRLAGAGRANQKSALRDLATEALELVGILQEVDDLDEIVLGLFNARDVLEGHPSVTLGQQFRLGLAKPHGLSGPGLHLADEEHPHADQQKHGKPVDQRIGQHRVALRRTETDLHILVAQFLELVLEIHQGTGGLNGRAIGKLSGDAVAGDHDRLDASGIGLVEEIRIADLRSRGASHLTLEQAEQREQQQRDDDPNSKIPELIHESPRIWPPGPRRPDRATVLISPVT